MTNGQFAVLAVLMTVASFVGGVLAMGVMDRVRTSSMQREVHTRAVYLVDSEGRTQAGIALDDRNRVVIFRGNTRP